MACHSGPLPFSECYTNRLEMNPSFWKAVFARFGPQTGHRGTGAVSVLIPTSAGDSALACLVRGWDIDWSYGLTEDQYGIFLASKQRWQADCEQFNKIGDTSSFCSNFVCSSCVDEHRHNRLFWWFQGASRALMRRGRSHLLSGRRARVLSCCDRRRSTSTRHSGVGMSEKHGACLRGRSNSMTSTRCRVSSTTELTVLLFAKKQLPCESEIDRGMCVIQN